MDEEGKALVLAIGSMFTIISFFTMLASFSGASMIIFAFLAGFWIIILYCWPEVRPWTWRHEE